MDSRSPRRRADDGRPLFQPEPRGGYLYETDERRRDEEDRCMLESRLKKVESDLTRRRLDDDRRNTGKKGKKGAGRGFRKGYGKRSGDVAVVEEAAEAAKAAEHVDGDQGAGRSWGWQAEDPEAEARRRQEEQQLEEENQRQEEQRWADEQLRKEEAARKQQEQAEKRLELEALRKEEVRAVVAVRAVFQRALNAEPETLDELKEEVRQALETETKALGSSFARLSDESEKVLKSASQRCARMVEERKRKAEREKQTEERREALEQHLAELCDLVDVAEAKTDLLKEAIEPMSREVSSVDDIGPLMATINEQGQEAQAAHAACQEFINANSLMTVDPSSERLTAVRAELLKLASRAEDSATLAEGLLLDARAAKGNAVRRLAAKLKVAEDDALFERYDVNGNGHWTKDAIRVFAQSELDFELDGTTVDRFVDLLVPGGDQNGVPRAKLQQLMAAVGIARDQKRSLELKAQREAKERVEAERRAVQQREFDEARAVVEEKTQMMVSGSGGLEVLESEVATAEEKVRPMVGRGANNMSLEELSSVVREMTSLSDTVGEHLGNLRERLEELVAEDSGLPDLVEFTQFEAKKLTMALDRLKARHGRVIAAVENGRMALVHRSGLEQEKVRAQVLGMLRNQMNDRQLAIEPFFALIDANSDGLIDETEFVEFLQRATNGDDVGPEKLRAFFEHIDSLSGASGRISLDGFVRLLKVCNRVVEPTVMTSFLCIKEGKPLRKLRPREVIEVFEGPRLEQNVGVMRVRGRAVSDGTEGWITVAGNQGKRYLEEGGNLWKVVEDTELQPDTTVTAASASIQRRLKKGELLEVLEWDKKGTETPSSDTKVRCVAREDGATGWALMKDASGTVYLEVV